jgi:tetratricopeptide (TPR) repeat protein
MSHPRVFVSYSWDDEQHRDRVLALTQQLRADGIDAWVDQFTPFAPQGWNAWMLDEIERASFVLCVITENYFERFRRRVNGGVGRGVKWEGSIISAAIFEDGTNEKFIPIFFDKADAEHTPFPLSVHIDLSLVQPDGYEFLFRLLTDQPTVTPVPLGPQRSMSSALPKPTVYRHRRDRGNLPRILYFFGRDDQLHIIERALDPTARTWIVLIDGPGGIGKTTLAIRAAELANESDYPRIVFASVKESELEEGVPRRNREFLVSGYVGILNTIARELGNKEFPKLDEKDRAAALHSLLRELPSLLVLDNLESLSEDDRLRLLEFLKNLPQGTKAIVTSRRRTDIQAEIIRLNQMPWPAANALLSELAGNSPLLAKASESDWKALYTNTGGNPLILRWVVGQLGRGQCRTIKCALDLLKNSPAGEKALEFIFGDLLGTFTDDEIKVLVALTYFTEPVAVEHIAEFAGLSTLGAQPVLESLADRALVVGDVELRHFALTPLVAEFLRRARPELVNESGLRLGNHVYALAVENQNRGSQGLDALEESWSIIEAALPILIADDNGRLQTVCKALDKFLSATARLDEWLILSKNAEEKALAAADFVSAGWRAYRVGWVHMLRGRGEEVVATANRAALHWQQVTLGVRERAFAIHLRGLGHKIRKEYSAAIAALSEALDLYRADSPENKSVVSALNEIGEVKRLTKDYVGAELDCREALRMASKIDCVEGIAGSTGNLAKLALDREQWKNAEELALKAWGLAAKSDRQDFMAEANLCVAKAYMRQDRFNEALPFARQAVQLCARLYSPDLAEAERALTECEHGSTRTTR